MQFRDYQLGAISSVIREWKEHQSTLIVSPTGSGKTIIIAGICQKVFPRRVLVLAHREELVTQNQLKITKMTGYRVDVEMAEHTAQLNDLHGGPQVVVSTIQTQSAGGDGGGRMSKFPPKYFGVVVVDEGHHSVGASYIRTLEYYKQNPNLKILGVTATPDRSDEEALGKVYETVAYDYEIVDAIRDGWLVPVQQQMVTVGTLDLSHVRTTAGDLNGKDLATVLETEKNLQGMIQPSLEILFGLKQQSLADVDPAQWHDFIQANATKRMKAIAFTASVKQAEYFADIFNRTVPGMAKWICGKTDKDERRATLAEFSSGKIQVVVNCAVLTEGYDETSVDCIIMARPTKSRSLYAQMAGRAMRPLPNTVDGLDSPQERVAAIAKSGKASMLILDYVGNSGKHKLMSAADILGGKVSDEAVERVKALLRKGGQRSKDMDKLLEEEEERLREERKKEQEERARLEAARRAHLTAKAKYSVKGIDPFAVWDIVPAKQRGWHDGKQLTQKQTDLLLKQGINPDGMPYAQAKQLLDELFRRWDGKLCTLKQAKVLARIGVDCKAVTMDHAGKIITALANNGWRRTAAVDAVIAAGA